MTLLAVAYALGAMTVFGIAAVLQGVATARAGDVAVLDPRLLLRLLRQPIFLVALALNGVGFLLHVAALQTLPLFLVQAVIAGSVAVTAVLSVRVFRAPLTSTQWGAVALVVAGLALLAPTALEGEPAPGGTTRAVVLGAAVVLLAVVAVAVRAAAQATVLLGLVAGGGFGVVAVCARLLPDLGPGLLTSPFPYLLAVAGAFAYLAYSAAMQRGAVTTATAAMVVTQTAVPAAAGLLLGDQVRPGLWPLALVGFALALTGALGLSRYEGGLLPTP